MMRWSSICSRGHKLLNHLTGRADLHMHTTASDGTASPREVLDYVAELGTLNVIAITDHDIMDASLWAYEQRGQYPFDIVPGMEVTSKGGHVLALWVTKPIAKGMSLADTTAAIHAQGGLAILAHPFEVLVSPQACMRYVQHPEVLLEDGIDALEIHNAGSPTPGNNWLAGRTAAKLGITITGNSDAHTLSAIGCGMTHFQGRTAADLRRALESGETAVEGRSWPITDYLRLLPGSTHRKLNAVLGMNSRLSGQTRS